MPKPLHLLIAEDNPTDAELLVRALRRSGFEPEWERVDTEADFLAGLRDGVELVLSDFEMPQFSGLHALQLSKAHRPEIPFIIVSGTIGEETAVEAMRLGAADYLLKDRLGRLGPAVTRALEEGHLRRERQHAELAVRASEARYRTLFEQAPDGILIADPQSYYLDANASMCRMLGYERAELIGLHGSDIVIPDEVQHIGPALDAIKARIGYHREWRFRRKDGSSFAAEVIATSMPDGNVLAMIRDITARQVADHRIREQLAELLRWQDVMLDREDRVQALKNEINTLLAQQDRPPRYGGSRPPQSP